MKYIKYFTIKIPYFDFGLYKAYRCLYRIDKKHPIIKEKGELKWNPNYKFEEQIKE